MATYNFNTGNDFSIYFRADATSTGTAFTESATADLSGGRGIQTGFADRTYGETTDHRIVERGIDDCSAGISAPKAWAQAWQREKTPSGENGAI